MDDTDKEIRKILTEVNGAGDYDLDREETLRTMMAESLRGRTRWMAIFAWVEGFVIFGLQIYVAVLFFQAENTRTQILYATMFLTLTLIMVLVKMWYWMLINRNSVKRELKRLELRVAELARAVSGR